MPRPWAEDLPCTPNKGTSKSMVALSYQRLTRAYGQLHLAGSIFQLPSCIMASFKDSLQQCCDGTADKLKLEQSHRSAVTPICTTEPKY